MTAIDTVLEPSAGTGLLAIFADLARGRLILNELAESRAGLLGELFPGIPVTRHDAAHIHDYLDAGLQPTVVLMNPPFSAVAHVETRIADAALRHIASALARLAQGGRLVAITVPISRQKIPPGATVSSGSRSAVASCSRRRSMAGSTRVTARRLIHA